MLIRLFLLPEIAGTGLGRRLLDIGIRTARQGHQGSIKVEATINAEGFYRRLGFRTITRGYFSHGVGGDLIEIVRMELRLRAKASDLNFTEVPPITR